MERNSPVSYAAVAFLVMAVVLPLVIMALGGDEEYLGLLGVLLVLVAVALGILSRGTAAGRIVLAAGSVLIIVAMVMAVLWAAMAARG